MSANFLKFGTWTGVVTLGVLMACSPAKFSSTGDNPTGCTSNCGTVSPTGTNYNYNVTIPNGPTQADVLFVIDNSNSMAPIQQELASRLGNFISGFSAGLDWHIGIITTDMDNDAPLKNGHLVPLEGLPGQYVINSATPNAAQIFYQTVMSVGENGSGDERGIYAALAAINRNEFGWIRPTGNLTVVILSDEGERSADGALSGFRLVSGKDYAEDLTSFVATAYPNKTFLTNSIIIDPNATWGADCLLAMNNSNGGSSYYGYQYAHLTSLTGGLTGNVCASDYGPALTNFGQAIIKKQDPIQLNCAPVDGKITVAFTPNYNSQPVLSGSVLSFNPAVPGGTVANLQYSCP